MQMSKRFYMRHKADTHSQMHTHTHTSAHNIHFIGFHTVHMLLLFLLHSPKDWQIKLS